MYVNRNRCSHKSEDQQEHCRLEVKSIGKAKRGTFMEQWAFIITESQTYLYLTPLRTRSGTGWLRAKAEILTPHNWQHISSSWTRGASNLSKEILGWIAFFALLSDPSSQIHWEGKRKSQLFPLFQILLDLNDMWHFCWGGKVCACVWVGFFFNKYYICTYIFAR